MWYIASEENIAYLAHHGVKGQRWGVRKRREQYAVNPNDPQAAAKARKRRIARNVGIGVGAAALAGTAAVLGTKFARNRKALNNQKFLTEHHNKLLDFYKSQGNEKGIAIASRDAQVAKEKADYLRKNIFRDGNEMERRKQQREKVQNLVKNLKNDYKEHQYQKAVNAVFKGRRR